MKVQLLRAWKAAALGCFFVAALLLITGTAVAYTVDVVNESDCDANVQVWESVFIGAKAQWESWIPKGQAYTFRTGAVCSALLSGSVNTGHGWLNIPDTGCAGHEGERTEGTCCFNIRFKIQKKDDGAYHFIKY